MRGYISILLIVLCGLLISCAKQETTTTGPHATVLMRDGTEYAGNVTGTTPTEVTVHGDDNTTRTIAMKDVKSIEYDDASAPPPPPAEQPKAGAKRARRQRSHDDHYHPEAAAVTSKTYELAPGTEVPVRSEETIDSARAAEGQTYAAEVIPSGANAQIVIRSATKGGRIRGSSDLVLDLASVSVGGQMYQLSTTDMVKQGKTGMGANKRTAEYTGGGAAIGAIIGAIAGHGKGAAIGAGSGAAAGALTQIVTKGDSIKVPAETVLTFKLDKPLRVVAAS